MTNSPKLPLKARTLHTAKRLARTLLVLYVLICLAMLLFQEKLIFPGAWRQGTADTQVRPDTGETLVRLKSPDDTPLTGLFGTADPPLAAKPQRPPATRLPVILFFYGNGMCMNDTDNVTYQLRALGCHTMLVDYEGYGMSGGKPSEQGCYNAAEAAYQYVLTRPDVDPHKLVAAGWSLGSAVAIDLAWRHRKDNTIVALMTFSGLTSMVDVAHHHYPFLPVSTLLRHRFMAADKMKDLTLPYFNGHGTHDSIVPFSCQHGLITAYGGTKDTLTTFQRNTDHNDFFDDTNDKLPAALAAFLEKVIK